MHCAKKWAYNWLYTHNKRAQIRIVLFYYYLFVFEKRLKVNNEPVANRIDAIIVVKVVFVDSSPVFGNTVFCVCSWLLFVACSWLLFVACSWLLFVACSWLLFAACSWLLFVACSWLFKKSLPSCGTIISVLSTCSSYFKFCSTYSW